MYPAFAHFRRTATRDVEMHGETIREGDKVLLWYVASNRDEDVYEDPQRLDVTRDARPPGVRRRRPPLLPRRGAGAARDQDPARARPCAASREIELAGEPTKARSLFLNQLKTLPVRLNP